MLPKPETNSMWVFFRKLASFPPYVLPSKLLPAAYCTVYTHSKPPKCQPSNSLMAQKGSVREHRRSATNGWSLYLSVVFLLALPWQSVATALAIEHQAVGNDPQG